MWLTSGEKGELGGSGFPAPLLIEYREESFLTVIARLVLNRSSECREEAVKELDEAPIVYCLRSALNKQKAFDGLRANGVFDFPVHGVLDFPVHGVLDFPVHGVSDFPVHGVLEFPVRGEPVEPQAPSRTRCDLCNELPSRDNRSRARNDKRGVAMTGEIVMRCST